jgi:hypothetical protein
MCAPNVEEEIKKLGPEVSKIYFEAKETLATSQDSRSERFSAASRIVRTFWKRAISNYRKPGLYYSIKMDPARSTAKEDDPS